MSTASSSKSRRKPRSLAWKLTVRQMGALVRVLVLVNAAVIVFFGSVLVVRCENIFSSIYVAGAAPAEDTSPAGDYSIQVHDRQPLRNTATRAFSQWSRQIFSTNPEGVARQFAYSSAEGDWYDKLDGLTYVVAYPITPEWDTCAWVIFHLGEWARGLKYFFKPFLYFQCAVVFFSVFKTRRSIKRALRPIEQLTLTAQSMSSDSSVAAVRATPLWPEAPGGTQSGPYAAGLAGKQAPPAVKGKGPERGKGPYAVKSRKKQPAPYAPYTPKPQKLHLSGAINTLNTINEDHLDMRISIADEREELRGLASAINNMLDRLNAAYQSQLRFVSDASHELRTPIAVIQGYANLLDRWGKTDEKTLQESIDAIKAEAGGMQDLVEQLLFLARSDNNSIALTPEAVDLSALAQEVLRDAQVVDEGHRFSAKVEEGLTVWGDAQLLKQAIRILMDNAIKYTPAHEQIIISARDGGEDVQVSVTDHGIGIPAEDLDQIFDRFFRADESRARQSGGTGLGLSIAKWIIDRHGGHVEVLSRQDMGTRMTYHLPKAEKQSAEQEEPEAV